MEVYVNHKNIKFSGKNRIKSLKGKAWRRVCRHDMETIHKSKY